MLFKRSLKQELFSTAAGAFLILFGIVIAQRAGYFIRLAAKGALPNDAITTVLSFSAIRFLPMLLSLTLFLAVLMTLSRWYRDSEMVIWFNSGLNINHWIRPVLTFALPVITLIFALSLFITPWAINKSESYRAQLESRDDLASITPGVFKESKHTKRIFFIESFDELGEVVKNIFVQSAQHQQLGIIVAAHGNRLIEKNGDHFLVMHNGRRYQGAQGGMEFSTTEFEHYAIRIEANEVKQPITTTQMKSTRELLRSQHAANSAELQWRLAIPISALILTLLAIPLSALDPRAGRSAHFVIAVIIYMIYNNSLSIMQAWVGQGKISATIGLWPIHLLFLLVTLFLFYQRLSQQSVISRLVPWQLFRIKK